MFPTKLLVKQLLGCLAASNHDKVLGTRIVEQFVAAQTGVRPKTVKTAWQHAMRQHGQPISGKQRGRKQNIQKQAAAQQWTNQSKLVKK